MRMTARIRAYAIGIKETIEKFGSLDISYESYPSNTVSTGYANSSMSTEEGWVLASIGADTNGSGRMLYKMNREPYGNTNISVGTKDHHYSASGSVTAWMVQVKKH